MKQKLVSISIPTFNCESIIEDCLKSIKNQTYKNIEIIIVDSFSTDNTPKIAKKYGKVYSFGRDPKQKLIFAVPYQRNFGVSKSNGDYIYYIDSDMRLTPTIIETCVKLMEENKSDAIIVPEEAYGEGFWAKCRTLEKSCYNKSDYSATDAARFVNKTVWNKLGGLDATLGGGDDWDFQRRLNLNNYKTIKSPVHILHYDGKLNLSKMIRKKFIYGKNTLDYFKKYRNNKGYLLKQFSFIRNDFIKNFDKLAKDPVHAVGIFIMKSLEYIAALAGIIYALINKEKIKIYSSKV